MKSTPRFNIKYPEGADKPKDFPAHTEALALSVESALIAASIPGTSNPDIRVCPTAAARNSYFGTPTTTAAQLALQARGPLAIRTDTDSIERYWAAKSASNPHGKATAGWYPVAGASVALPPADLITSNAASVGAGFKLFRNYEGFVTGEVDIGRSTNTDFPNGGDLVQLPVGWRPESTVERPGAVTQGGSPGFHTAQIQTNGWIRVWSIGSLAANRVLRFATNYQAA
ncbi:hypothetical protein [Leucobacter ruminantium]|uniref:Uncharacterized protein n=1 Tax=Leucobacter ruminantium TaxID=1289170 RepID=A0A939RUL2_9MICO|nr:hypothetical protein [Leucobacter ruminantium]MBO1805895.1 hypothetical protein [Leucobacter ruminantium]